MGFPSVWINTLPKASCLIYLPILVGGFNLIIIIWLIFMVIIWLMMVNNNLVGGFNLPL